MVSRRRLVNPHELDVFRASATAAARRHRHRRGVAGGAVDHGGLSRDSERHVRIAVGAHDLVVVDIVVAGVLDRRSDAGAGARRVVS